MPQIGPLEVMMVVLIALVVFGPQKLPGMARSAGRTLNDLRRAAGDMNREVNDMKREVKAGLRDEESADRAAAESKRSTDGDAV